MAKKFIYHFIFYAVLLFTAVLWLLSITMEDAFGFFNLSLAVALISGATGTLFIVSGVLEKNLSLIKKSKIFLGAGLLVITLFCLITALSIPENVVAPIIAIIIAFCLLISYVAVGGKKWDQGDNKKVGYKNYHQRKKKE